MVAREAVVLMLMDYAFHHLSRNERICLVSMALLELAREEGGSFADPGPAYLAGLEPEEYEACVLQLHRSGWIVWTRCARVSWTNINHL